MGLSVFIFALWCTEGSEGLQNRLGGAYVTHIAYSWFKEKTLNPVPGSIELQNNVMIWYGSGYHRIGLFLI